ncbi:calcium-binding protein [Tistrella mobilis]
MSIDNSTNDDVILNPGDMVDDTRGSDHYTSVPVNGGAPYQITFNAASALQGDVDVVDNLGGGVLRLHGTISTGTRGDDLVIRMLEMDDARGETIDHYVYISDYYTNPSNISLLTWSNGTYVAFTPPFGNYLDHVGSNGDDVITVQSEPTDYGYSVGIVHALNGNDTIFADGGAHQLFGGGGDDTYVLYLDMGTFVPIVTDSSGDSDVLRLAYTRATSTLDASSVSSLGQLDNLAAVYYATSGVEYLETDLGERVRWGWDSYTPGTIGMISGVRNDTPEGVFDGTDGSDILIAGQASDGLGRIIDGGAGDDRLVGSSDADELRGGDGTDLIMGFAGNDILRGGSGNDMIDGGTGNNVLYGDEGDDVFYVRMGTSNIDGGQGNDTIDYTGSSSSVRVVLSEGRGVGGEALNDTYVSIENVIGSSYADILIGDDKANILSGGSGDDVLIGGAGPDQLNGGDGFDIISYSNASAGVAVLLRTGLGERGDAQGDVYTGIEGVHGSAYNDIIYGDANNNTLRGFGGNDVLIGGAGADLMDGGEGFDTVSYSTAGSAVTVRLDLGRAEGTDAAGDVFTSIEAAHGSAFNDTIYGDGKVNTLKGLGGNDILVGGAGGDRLEGGDGFDTALYRTASAGVRIDLAAGKGFGSDAQNDVLLSIEALEGSRFADLLVGDGAANRLTGWDGNDRMAGRGGVDILTGGRSADTFVYSTMADSGVGVGNRDIITDFSRSEHDRIELSNIDAMPNKSGDQAFTFLGTSAFTGNGGEVRYIAADGYRVIEIDIDGDRTTDMQIQLNGNGTLYASDFIL